MTAHTVRLNKALLYVLFTTLLHPLGHWHLQALVGSEVFFKIKFTHFSGTLTLQIYVFIIQINIFPGELSNISAKTATLLVGNMSTPGV